MMNLWTGARLEFPELMKGLGAERFVLMSRFLRDLNAVFQQSRGLIGYGMFIHAEDKFFERGN